MPRNKQIEKEIEDKFVQHAFTLGVEAKKLIDNEETGFPDRTCLCPSGYVFFIEFKKPGESPNQKQELIHKELRNLGFHVYACDNLENAKCILTAELNR